MIRELSSTDLDWSLFKEAEIQSSGGMDELKRNIVLLSDTYDGYVCIKDGVIVAFGFFCDYNEYYEGCIIPTIHLEKYAKSAIKEMRKFIKDLGKPLETTSLDDKNIDKWHRMLGMKKIKEHTQKFKDTDYNLWRIEWA